jgi:CRP/FNR family cyclic AMP-dependent transcriptional regulator
VRLVAQRGELCWGARNRRRALGNMCHAVTEWMDLQELRQLLALVDVFERLPPEELRVLASGASLQRLGAKETMMVGPREHARRVLVLLSGRATVYEPGPRGRSLTVSVAEAGTLVGAAGFSERALGLRVEASMPCVCCLLGREAFEGVVLRNLEVGLRLLRVLGERVRVLEERLADMAHREVPARLASAILRLVEGEGVMGPEGGWLPTRYTHAQLASMIGANREATNRALRTLRERGAVEVRERRIHVVDPEALERAAWEA